MKNSCMFFGDKDLIVDENVKAKISKYINLRIENCSSFFYFYFCDFNPYSRCCYKIVTKLKENNNSIKRFLFYIDNKISLAENRNKIETDDFEYLFHADIFLDDVLLMRNKKAVDNASFIIFFVDTSKINSLGTKTLNYAKEKNIEFINIFNI